MENRSLPVVAGLIALLALPFAVMAAESGADAEPQAAWQARLDKAAAMQSASKAQQAEANKVLERKNAICATKFLVNDCRNEAYQEYVKTTREARRQENEGKALEREVKKEQISARDKRQAEEVPRRAADLQLRQEETMAARQMADDKATAARADKARKSVDGEQRKLADAERLHKKQEAHAARVAKKKLEAEQRAAQAGAKK